MITLFSGVPGSGKSLHLAQELCDSYLANRPIVTNFPLRTDKLFSSRKFLKRKNTNGYILLSNQDLSPKLLYEYSTDYFSKHKYKEGHILLCIDECQLLFNSRDWSKSNRNSWLEFFTQHRKLGFEIILVAQFDRMIDRQIRCLIETEIEHRQVRNFSKIAQFIPFTNNVFCAIERYYPINERLGCTFFVKQKKYYSVYDTNFMFNS